MVMVSYLATSRLHFVPDKNQWCRDRRIRDATWHQFQVGRTALTQRTTPCQQTHGECTIRVELGNFSWGYSKKCREVAAVCVCMRFRRRIVPVAELVQPSQMHFGVAKRFDTSRRKNPFLDER